MPNDAQCPEEPNVVSLGTFDDLKAYFDQKFSQLKGELSDDQVKSSSSLMRFNEVTPKTAITILGVSSLAKKLKSETSLTFKFSGNKKHFEFNTETLEHVGQSLPFVQSLKSLVDLEHSENQEVSVLILKFDEPLNAASKAIKRRNKFIRIADKSEAVWPAVDEFLSDEVASGSDDKKKIRVAEQRALRKKKNAALPSRVRS